MEGEECTHICTSTWHMRCVRRVGPGGTLNTRARRGSVWRSVGGDDCGAALALPPLGAWGPHVRSQLPTNSGRRGKPGTGTIQ
jgi:hypothetical protein